MSQISGLLGHRYCESQSKASLLNSLAIGAMITSRSTQTWHHLQIGRFESMARMGTRMDTPLPNDLLRQPQRIDPRPPQTGKYKLLIAALLSREMD